MEAIEITLEIPPGATGYMDAASSGAASSSAAAAVSSARYSSEGALSSAAAPAYLLHALSSAWVKQYFFAAAYAIIPALSLAVSAAVNAWAEDVRSPVRK